VRPVVELQSISKVFGGADVVVRAVDGVDLVVERGDHLAVMGASGSGKSALMNIIGCLDAATSGRNSPRRTHQLMAAVRPTHRGESADSPSRISRLTVTDVATRRRGFRDSPSGIWGLGG